MITEVYMDTLSDSTKIWNLLIQDGSNIIILECPSQDDARALDQAIWKHATKATS